MRGTGFAVVGLVASLALAGCEKAEPKSAIDDHSHWDLLTLRQRIPDGVNFDQAETYQDGWSAIYLKQPPGYPWNNEEALLDPGQHVVAIRLSTLCCTPLPTFHKPPPPEWGDGVIAGEKAVASKFKFNVSPPFIDGNIPGPSPINRLISISDLNSYGKAGLEQTENRIGPPSSVVAGYTKFYANTSLLAGPNTTLITWPLMNIRKDPARVSMELGEERNCLLITTRDVKNPRQGCSLSF